jgi:type II secretory pathway component GspD/PulD (secretin)
VAAAPAAPTLPPSNSNLQRDPNAIIPLIVMDEVPLTDAIKNLARQAGLNYMLDPKINYGAAGPDGHVSNPQPTVSLRWENLTADQALNAVLNNYNLIIVDDPKTKIARITIKDPAAPDPLTTKIVQLKYAYATNLLMNAQAVLLDKRSKVMADARTSQLVVVATDKEMAAIDELISRLDTPTKQVLIEAKLVETTKNPTSAKGIDWSGTLQAQHVTFGNGSGYWTPPAGAIPGSPLVSPQSYTSNNTTYYTPVIPGTAGTPATPGLLNGILTPGTPGLTADTKGGFNPATFFLNADGVSAVLSFLNTSADAQVLSTPRAVTLDNEEATLSVTVAQPIFLTTAGTQGSPGGAQVVYTNLGTILRVTPRISANNTISLKVIPEVSDIGPVVTKTVAGLEFQADSYNIRKFATQVLIPSGNTLVMGGLVSDSRSKGSTKVPILGDIPLLGWAFHQETKVQDKRNLIIFITPTIVQNEDFQPTETSFLKTKMKEKSVTDFGAWDSGEPQDWSKLFHSKKPTDIDDSNN